MTDKYQAVLELLDTYRTANQVSDILGWTKSTTYHYIKRMNELGYLEKEELAELKGAPCQYKRLIHILTDEHLDNLHNRKSKHRSDIVIPNTEINAIYNNYLYGMSPAEIHAKARVITETKSYSEKKKSPRVHIGCSFGLSGW